MDVRIKSFQEDATTFNNILERLPDYAALFERVNMQLMAGK